MEYEQESTCSRRPTPIVTVNTVRLTPHLLLVVTGHIDVEVLILVRVLRRSPFASVLYTALSAYRYLAT